MKLQPFQVRKMRRNFFLQNLLKFLLPGLAPVIIYSLLTIRQTNNEIKHTIENYSINTLSFSMENFEMMFLDLLYYRILIDSKPSTMNDIFLVLGDYDLSQEIFVALNNLERAFFSISRLKSYIHSIYIGSRNSRYMINSGQRQLIAEAMDREWFDHYLAKDMAANIWLEAREIQLYPLIQRKEQIASLYLRIRFNGIMVINLYAKYFNRMLDSAAIYSGQSLMLLDSNFQPVFKNSNFESLPPEIIAAGIEIIKKGEVSKFRLKNYFFTFLPSEVYGLYYVSFIPEKSAYGTLYIIMSSMIITAILSTAIAFVLAYYFTKSNYNALYRIVQIFDLAEKGQVIPTPGSRNDTYSYILEQVVNVFVTQSFMKEQLASRKYELLSAQLAALQYQINPHFLFNTLQSIDIEIRHLQENDNKASLMINRLARILRYSLDDPMKPVEISEEIGMAKDYLEIQKYRGISRFAVTWDYRKTILKYKTLRLLLQPLLENAIFHGAMENSEATLIKVSIKKQKDLILFRITNNGPAIDAEKLNEIRETLIKGEEISSKHIGLTNINRRLCLHYDIPGLALALKNIGRKGFSVSFFIRINMDNE
jgi:two-component system sensor histidine kinase YesM